MPQKPRPESLSPLWRSYIATLEARLVSSVANRETRARRLTRVRRELRIEQARTATLEAEIRRLQSLVDNPQTPDGTPTVPPSAEAVCAEPQTQHDAATAARSNLIPLWQPPAGARPLAPEGPAE